VIYTYLNKEDRILYTEALKHVQSLGNLDEGVKEHLFSINKNENIRTMYSKRGKLNKGSVYNHSYLHICYSKEVEDLLESKLKPLLIDRYHQKEYRSTKLNFLPGTPHRCGDEDGGPEWEYVRTPGYWDIKYFNIELVMGTDDLHESFWNELSQELSKIGL